MIQVTNDQIIKLLAEGMTIKEIAGELGMKGRTVRDRISEMKKANGCSSIAQLVYKLHVFPLMPYAPKVSLKTPD